MHTQKTSAKKAESPLRPDSTAAKHRRNSLPQSLDVAPREQNDAVSLVRPSRPAALRRTKNNGLGETDPQQAQFNKNPKNRHLKQRPPCYYQAFPWQRSIPHAKGFTNRSPTHSIESRKRWAEKQCVILAMNHRTHPPTHFGTIKLSRPASIAEVKTFLQTCRLGLKYNIRRTGRECAVYLVLEIERNNCFHFHLLIRTTAVDPQSVLGRIVAKAGEGLAALKYCKPVRDITAATKYVVKAILAANGGKKTPLLLKKGLGLHHVTQWNGYFVASKSQLWKKWIQEKYGQAV